MNRAERRKAGKKGQQKTYTFNSHQSMVKATLEGPGREAMTKEIDRQIMERVDRMESDIDAAILWALHVSCGFGPKRLVRFYRDYIKVYREMRKRYVDEDCYAEKMKLKAMGVDVMELREEVEKDDLL